jgi:hypothetical protein
VAGQSRAWCAPDRLVDTSSVPLDNRNQPASGPVHGSNSREYEQVATHLAFWRGVRVVAAGCSTRPLCTPRVSAVRVASAAMSLPTLPAPVPNASPPYEAITASHSMALCITYAQRPPVVVSYLPHGYTADDIMHG